MPSRGLILLVLTPGSGQPHLIRQDDQPILSSASDPRGKPQLPEPDR